MNGNIPEVAKNNGVLVGFQGFEPWPDRPMRRASPEIKMRR